MVEQQKQRVEQEMTKMIDEVDRSYLRKMQATMHKCAVKCCEDMQKSTDGVQRCVQNCSVPLHNAQEYIQKEIGNLQNRLQRCVMECNDSIKDKMGPDPSDNDVDRYTTMFEDCAVKCVDKHIELIPTYMKAIKTVLAKQSSQTEVL